MTAALPNGRRGQMLALAITLMPLFLLWFGVVGPLLDVYGERADRLTQRLRVAQRMAQVAADLPALKDRASAVIKAGPPPMQTLDGASDAVAAAALQNRVQDMATTAGARLTSVEILEAGAAGDYRRIGLKLSLSAPWPVLVGLLQAIEQSSLPMVIDGLQIRAASNAAANAKDGDPRPLDASFTVTAFRILVPSTPPEKAS